MDRPRRNPVEDPDLDDTPRPDELPGGVAFERAWSEADAYARRTPADPWRTSSSDERIRYATWASIARRHVNAQSRRAGYPSFADYLRVVTR